MSYGHTSPAAIYEGTPLFAYLAVTGKLPIFKNMQILRIEAMQLI